MIKDSKYIKIDSVNPLNLIIGKVNGNEYLVLVPTNEGNK